MNSRRELASHAVEPKNCFIVEIGFSEAYRKRAMHPEMTLTDLTKKEKTNRMLGKFFSKSEFFCRRKAFWRKLQNDFDLSDLPSQAPTNEFFKQNLVIDLTDRTTQKFSNNIK
jgi:hypothetical protein